MDDLIIYDNSGSGLTAADWPTGPLKCQTLRPTRDASVAWARSTGSDNYALVDEANPDTADYVSSSTPGQIDRYGYGDITGTPLAIKALSLITGAVNMSAGFSSYKAHVRVGGTSYDGATRNTPASARRYLDAYDLDPSTSAEWTASAVNALQAGVELVS
jgi:hypothetical protein